MLGAEHPDTLSSVSNLASLLYCKGDYAGAQPLFERALTGLLNSSRAMGCPHPRLRGSLGNYARCLEKTGKTTEEVQTILRRLLDHYGLH